MWNVSRSRVNRATLHTSTPRQPNRQTTQSRQKLRFIRAKPTRHTEYSMSFDMLRTHERTKGVTKRTQHWSLDATRSNRHLGNLDEAARNGKRQSRYAPHTRTLQMNVDCYEYTMYFVFNTTSLFVSVGVVAREGSLAALPLVRRTNTAK